MRNHSVGWIDLNSCLALGSSSTTNCGLIHPVGVNCVELRTMSGLSLIGCLHDASVENGRWLKKQTGGSCFRMLRQACPALCQDTHWSEKATAA